MDYLHSFLLSRAKENPTAIAIEDVTGAYSYACLSEKAFSWFQYLRSLTLKRGDRLVLVADSSFAAVAILTGCSMAGVIFTVISPEVPQGRREAIIGDLEPALVVFDTNTMDMSTQQISQEKEAIFNRFVIKYVGSAKREVECITTPIQLSVDPVYIVFTSGSTGSPKGIVMSHRAVVSFLGGLVDHMQLRSDGRYATLSPLQFDFALFDIGLCLGSGATLVIPNRALLRKPEQLVNQLANLKITHFSGVPTIWKLIIQSASDSIPKMNLLETIVFAGEHFPVEHMRTIKEILPTVEFYNAYGQSETIGCAFHVLRPEDFSKPHMPVGRGHRDMELILIDEDGSVITAPGVPGELLLKGSTLFSGYWKQPEQTKLRLIQNPQHSSYVDPMFQSGDICYFDEERLFYFIGRKDNQIKVNGNRVELEEIEAGLNRFPGVSNSCVLAVNGDQGYILHAALVFSGSPDVDQSEHEPSLRSFLAADLSSYMLPKHYHFMESIPINANGKNDRKKLVNALGLEVQ